MVSVSASITEEYPNTAPLAHHLKISKWLPFTDRLDTFQTAASALGRGVSKSVKEPFKRYFSVHHSIVDLMGVSPYCFSTTSATGICISDEDLDQQLCKLFGKFSECSILTIFPNSLHMCFKVGFVFVFVLHLLCQSLKSDKMPRWSAWFWEGLP